MFLSCAHKRWTEEACFLKGKVKILDSILISWKTKPYKCAVFGSNHIFNTDLKINVCSVFWQHEFTSFKAAKTDIKVYPMHLNYNLPCSYCIGTLSWSSINSAWSNSSKASYYWKMLGLHLYVCNTAVCWGSPKWVKIPLKQSLII